MREMRRKNQALTKAECEAILDAGSCGVLALTGDGGYPYAVPLSYVYADNAVYFHCATAGHKLDAVRSDPRASFCVVGRDTVVGFTTLYLSVILFGRVRIVENATEKLAALKSLARKYAPGDEQGADNEIAGAADHACVLTFEIERMTGKQAVELSRKNSGV